MEICPGKIAPITDAARAIVGQADACRDDDVLELVEDAATADGRPYELDVVDHFLVEQEADISDDVARVVLRKVRVGIEDGQQICLGFTGHLHDFRDRVGLCRRAGARRGHTLLVLLLTHLPP